jgi:hypothetical protein
MPKKAAKNELFFPVRRAKNEKKFAKTKICVNDRRAIIKQSSVLSGVTPGYPGSFVLHYHAILSFAEHVSKS